MIKDIFCIQSIFNVSEMVTQIIGHDHDHFIQLMDYSFYLIKPVDFLQWLVIHKKQDYDTASACTARPTNHRRELRLSLTQTDGAAGQRSDQKPSDN